MLMKVLPFAIRRFLECRSNFRVRNSLQKEMVGAFSGHKPTHLGIFEIRYRVVRALFGSVAIGVTVATFSDLAIIDLSTSKVEMIRSTPRADFAENEPVELVSRDDFGEMVEVHRQVHDLLVGRDSVQRLIETNE